MGKQFWKQPADQLDGPGSDHPYWRRICDKCGKKGIYHWRNKVVCRDCLGELEGDLKADSKRWESKFGQYNKGVR